MLGSPNVTGFTYPNQFFAQSEFSAKSGVWGADQYLEWNQGSLRKPPASYRDLDSS